MLRDRFSNSNAPVRPFAAKAAPTGTALHWRAALYLWERL
ncbi:hypothetical protein RK21_04040 [Pseudomonas plecoglossicida]|nr:hypothetical protein RK21_04040 [Pseudomonas plecoglossicida]